VSGVAVIWYLIKSNSPVLAVVPVAQIMSGPELPIGTPMPAILVGQIDSIPFHLIRANEGKEHTDRVQVTVFRKTDGDDGYPGLKPLLDLVIAACPSQRGTINGVAVDSITVDMEGPDLSIPDLSIVSRSRDFIVRWHT